MGEYQLEYIGGVWHFDAATMSAIHRYVGELCKHTYTGGFADPSAHLIESGYDVNVQGKMGEMAVCAQVNGRMDWVIRRGGDDGCDVTCTRGDREFRIGVKAITKPYHRMLVKSATFGKANLDFYVLVLVDPERQFARLLGSITARNVRYLPDGTERTPGRVRSDGFLNYIINQDELKSPVPAPRQNLVRLPVGSPGEELRGA